MLEVFEEIGAGRSLLILGAPGSGKTTMLLELARQLIERAHDEENEPIPVVFNLASWTEKQSLADWLANQLNIVYFVPKKTATRWVSENEMLLLLDGLDEVKQEIRAKCVEVINQFRNEHGLTSLVVCSRIEEYTAINTKLSLEGAIKIQPLTSKQVNTYLDKFGKSLASVKQLLRKDKTLRELAETPLMLSIMTLAYKDKNPEELPNSNDNGEQHKHIFDAYINRMFERPTRSKNTLFAKTQTLYFLRWLARKMIQHNLTTYQIEVMQPSWLTDDKQQRLHKWIFGLIVGLIAGLISGLISGLIFGLTGGLIFGLIFGLIAGLIFGPSKEINTVDRLSWSWKASQDGLISGLIVGLISGLISGLIGGLIVGLIVGLGGGLLLGLRGEQLEETTYPGQHLKQTLFSGFSAGIVFGLTIGLVSELIFRLTGGLFGGQSLRLGLIGRLIGGLIFGLIFGFQYGIATLIQHYTLRFLLTKNGLLPRHLISFLEYAVDLIFLRRVGGSYIFVHRLLMEHFAEVGVE